LTQFFERCCFGRVYQFIFQSRTGAGGERCGAAGQGAGKVQAPLGRNRQMQKHRPGMFGAGYQAKKQAKKKIKV
jgi:hypothetical protein